MALICILPARSFGIGADFCTGLPVISSLPYSDGGSQMFLTNNYNICGSLGGRDAFYALNLSTSTFVRASLCGGGTNFNSALSARTGGACPGDTRVACTNYICGDDGEIVFFAAADTTYYLITDEVHFESNNSLGYSLHVTHAVENDLCPGQIIPILPYTNNSSTAIATHQYSSTCYTQQAPDLVYHYTSPDSILVRASMVASWFDCLQVRRNNCETGASLYCDTGSGPDSSWFEFWTEPDSTYYFIVDGASSSDSGNYTFSLQVVNDVCPGTVVSDLPYTNSRSTAYASHQYSGSCYTQAGRDVVYNYTSTDSVLVKATMVASWFDCMHVRRNNCTTGASLLCDLGVGPDSSWFVFWAEPDSSYYFILDGGTTKILELTPSRSLTCPAQRRIHW
ncbi:MAG: hypothetical protein IPP40_15065 [bacterium]|nr:hypothetical protein [bacterium]